MSGKPVIGIHMVLPTFQVITSKQRPRKFSIKGVDGKEYTYLLKGAYQGSSSWALLTEQGTRTCDKTRESCSSSA